MSKSLSKKAAMAKGVLLAVLTPKLAADKMPDLNGILADVGRKNWLSKKPGIVAALKPAMATDADLESLVELLDSLDGEEPGDNDLSMDDESGKAVSEILDTLRGKISDEDLAVVEGKLKAMAVPVAHMAPEAAAAADTPPPFPGKPEVGGGQAEAGKEDDKVSKPAMDAAIAAAVQAAESKTIARMQAVQEAHKIVAPYVGELAMACDSAEDVFKGALKVLGVKTKKVHPSAYRALLEAQPLPGSQNARQVVAQDSAKSPALDKFLAELNLPATR